MNNLDKNKKELKKLIETFDYNIEQYKSKNYDEANTRVDFIDKFFELLDWDVRNTENLAEQYRQVVREDKIIIAGKPKAPDYSFRIYGQRKFFVEAKKPTVVIKKEQEPALHLDINKYPAVKKYLKSFGKRIEQTGEKGSRKKTNNKWFETQDQIGYYEEFEKEKVVWKALGLKPSFTYIKDTIYNNDKANILTGCDNIKFLCGFLNSNMFQFIFSSIGVSMGKGYEYKVKYVEKIPIPPITDSNRKLVEEIESLVDNMLETQEKIQSSKTEADKKLYQNKANAIDKKIDAIVYDLYELTEEEREIVENSI